MKPQIQTISRKTWQQHSTNDRRLLVLSWKCDSKISCLFADGPMLMSLSPRLIASIALRRIECLLCLSSILWLLRIFSCFLCRNWHQTCFVLATLCQVQKCFLTLNNHFSSDWSRYIVNHTLLQYEPIFWALVEFEIWGLIPNRHGPAKKPLSPVLGLISQ